LQALQTGDIQFLEYTLQISDKIRHYESRAIRYTKNQVLRIVRDITEQKDALEENKQLIAELQMLNEELTSSEEEIRQTLEHTIELKNEIQRREAYYKTLIDASPDIVICIDKQMRIEFMQMPKETKNITDDCLGRNLLEMIADEQIRQKAEIAVKHVIDTLQAAEYDSSLIIDGQETFYHTYYAPIISNNQLISIYILTRDITESKRTEKEFKNMSRNLQTTIDNSQQSTILLDTKGNIILTDVKTKLQVEKYLGKTLNIGEPLLDTMPTQLQAGFLENFPKVLQGEHFTVERKVVLPTGTVWTEISYSPVFDDNMHVVAVVIGQMDITARKETEEYLRKVNADLVNQNKQLSHYSYVVSHNLRSPVATILGLTNLLEMENITDVGTLDLLRMLKLATEKLDDVVKDLNLILSETQIVQENKQIIYFEAELMNIMGSLRQQIQHCNPIIRYEFNQAPLVFASKTLVHNVLFNLFTNALKFRQPHTQLELDIYTEQEENYTCLIIRDNGMGIDMIKQEENLFKLYKRFHPQIEGKGIGLYLLKTQIEMQGGKIELKSEIDKGTMVKVFFANDN
jgi:PAS domain S-box-containing protein